MLVLGLWFGCSGNPPPPPDPVSCSEVAGLQAYSVACVDSSGCPDHFECTTVNRNTNLKCCVFVERRCATEADCCPGQACLGDRRTCFDRFVACNKDADCGAAGDRFCRFYYQPNGTSGRCTLNVCSATVACPVGQACFQGQCLAGPPCDGWCQPGTGCVTDRNRCQDYASPTARQSSACPMTCNAGFIATFTDPTNLWDGCNLPAVRCTCAALPVF